MRDCLQPDSQSLKNRPGTWAWGVGLEWGYGNRQTRPVPRNVALGLQGSDWIAPLNPKIQRHQANSHREPGAVGRANLIGKSTVAKGNSTGAICKSTSAKDNSAGSICKSTGAKDNSTGAICKSTPLKDMSDDLNASANLLDHRFGAQIMQCRFLKGQEPYQIPKRGNSRFGAGAVQERQRGFDRRAAMPERRNLPMGSNWNSATFIRCEISRLP